MRIAGTDFVCLLLVATVVKRGKAALSREEQEIKALETKLGLSSSKGTGLTKLKKCVHALLVSSVIVALAH